MHHSFVNKLMKANILYISSVEIAFELAFLFALLGMPLL